MSEALGTLTLLVIALRTIVEPGLREDLDCGVTVVDVVTVLVWTMETGTVTVNCSVTVTVEGGIDMISDVGNLVPNSFSAGVFVTGYVLIRLFFEEKKGTLKNKRRRTTRPIATILSIKRF